MTQAPRVALTAVSAAVLRHLLADDLGAASQESGLPLPAAFLEDKWLWEFRVGDIEADPTRAAWLIHAVVDESGAVVGHAGFHGPPDAAGMVEAGYTIVAEHRGRGYAKAALAELIALARARGATTLRATVSPDNLASLAVVKAHGLTHVGEQMDDVDGLELVFEITLDGNAPAL